MDHSTAAQGEASGQPSGGEAAADRLERLWREGGRPDVDAFLAAAGPLPPDEAAAVLRLDQRQRWQIGERVPAEDYLRRHPWLREHSEAAVDLVYGEFLLRERLGERPELDEYLRRFPEYAEILRPQVELHGAMVEDLGNGASPPPRTFETATLPAAPLPPPEPAAPAVPGYEILGELGRGGMGVVYQAVQVGLNRVVALKMILSGGHAGEQARSRFQAEAEAVARLRHPHIVQIYEVGESGGCPFFSLEFVEGGSLAQKLDGTPWQPRQAAELVETLARAVHAAHQQQVVHRDLKPANVLLTADGAPKVSDFGLAKRLDESAGPTRSGQVMGTPSYMAPEQAGGKSKEIGPAADVYALGAILYELLTGRPPFKAATPLDTVLQVVAEEPAPPRRLQSKIPADLETVCLKCLEKRPETRYASAQELADDLRAFLRGEPIRARPVGVPERWARWCRRNPHMAGLGGLVAAALAAVAVISALFAWHAARSAEDLKASADAAERQRVKAERRLAENYLDHALEVMDRDKDPARGMLEAVRALEALPPDSPDLDRSIRASLTACAHEVVPFRLAPAPRFYVMAAAFSPDGSFLFSGSRDHTAQVWDAATGRPLGEPLRHDHAVNAVAVSPDGRTLLTGCDGGTVRRWDRATGKPAGDAMVHPDDVNAVAFSPDGSTVLTGCGDGKARLWSAATARRIGSEMKNTASVLAVAFDPGGRVVAAGCDDGTARLWSAETGEQLGETMTLPQKIPCVAFLPDGQTLVTGCWDGGVDQWDVPTGRHLGRLFRNGDAILSVAVSPDGRTLLTGGGDASARIWDAGTGRALGPAMQHRSWVQAVAYRPDGQAVLTGGADGTIRLWDADRAAPAGETAPLPADADPQIVSPDEDEVLTYAGGTLRLWDLPAGHFLPTAIPLTGKPAACAFRPDGRALVTADGEGKVRVWALPGGEPTGVTISCPGGVRDVALSPDGGAVLTGGADGQVRLWDAITGRARGEAFDHADAVLAVAFGPEGGRAATGSMDGTARLWDLRTGRPLGRPLVHNVVGSVAFRPDGRAVLTGGWDGTAQQWDAETGDPIGPPLVHSVRVLSVAYGPNGRTLATAASDGTRLWEAATGRLLGPPRRRLAATRFVGFSADGKTVLVIGLDRAVRRFAAPAPVAGEVGRLKLWAQVLTGLELDENDVVRVLDPDVWNDRRRLLDEAGGPPTP